MKGSCARILWLTVPWVGLLACDPFGTLFPEEEGAVLYTASSIKEAGATNRVRVMTYNVKFGGARVDFFFDCHGDEVLMSRSVVEDNMAALAKLIRAADPDILFVQEVDILSKRSAYVDQVQYLLDETDLNYAAYASQWKADYVPSDGLGAVDSGNAILSKWPLENAVRLALPLRSDQSGIERYFYLKRNILIADVTPWDEAVRLVVTHTDAYSKDGTKPEQIRLFEEQLDLAEGLVIGAGDLNTLPPGTRKQHEFDDSVCTDEDFQADDYREESELLESLYEKYEPAISREAYKANNAPYFTHTTSGDGFWNRKLDYIFTSGQVIAGSGVTHQDASTLGIETMPLSDHAPITVEIALQ